MAEWSGHGWTFVGDAVGNDMPEGHTIHRMARDHRRWLSGGPVRASSPQGRFEAEARDLDGLHLLGTNAWGKHLFHHYGADGGAARWVLHVHLGLFGRVRMQKAPMKEPRGQIRLRLEGPSRGVDLSGPNTCELLKPDEVRSVTARLGPDPLRSDADPEGAWAALQRRRSPLGAVLMDQAVLAGIGNIYRTELLWLLKLDPMLPANQLSRADFDALWSLSAELLALGVRTNRIITVPLDPSVNPHRLRRGERLNIFKRPRCPRCEAPIVELELRKRRAFLCPVCQEGGGARRRP